jgi:hypothetical protein
MGKVRALLQERPQQEWQARQGRLHDDLRKISSYLHFKAPRFDLHQTPPHPRHE